MEKLNLNYKQTTKKYYINYISNKLLEVISMYIRTLCTNYNYISLWQLVCSRSFYEWTRLRSLFCLFYDSLSDHFLRKF